MNFQPHVKTAWKKFKELLSVLSSRHLSFQDPWSRVQLLCAELNASCQWDLATDSQTSNVCSEMTGQWSGRSRMSSRKTLPPPDPMSYLRAGPHSEGEKAPLVWTCGMLQWCSQDSLWPTDWWKVWAWEAKDDMKAADREGLQRVEALGYQPSWQTYPEIWCEIFYMCSKPATRKMAHWCGCCPCTCMLIKNPLMMIDDRGVDFLS